MLETCKRRNVEPNPGSISSLRTIWKAFNDGKNTKLFFIGYKGIDISSEFAIAFGEILYLWKFGWSGELGTYKPNDVFNWEIIKWAKKNGYSYIDFETISIDTDKHVKDKSVNVGGYNDSSSSFKLKFGGDVLYFPEAYVYFHNQIIRWIYRRIIRSTLGRKVIRMYA